MGLMQLLTVGRSLSEAKDQPHRYKLRTDGWPTFGNGSPGFRRGSAAMADAVRQEGEQAMNDLTAAEKNAETKQAYPQGRWSLGAANPFKSSRPAVRPTVQGELSLDAVKPLRNDLSDTDLELLPRKPKAEADAQQNVFAPTSAAAKPSWWVRVKSKLSRSKGA